MWHNWVNGVLGLWILISPFLGFTPTGMTTNLVIVGIVVAVLGFAGAFQVYNSRDFERHQHA